MKSSIAIATGIGRLGASPFEVDSRWRLSRFTDGWVMVRFVPQPKVSSPQPPVLGGGLKVFILDDGNTHIVSGSAPVRSFIEEFSNVTGDLYWWTSRGVFRIDMKNSGGGAVSYESRSIPVVVDDQDQPLPLVDEADAVSAANLKAGELGWPQPGDTSYRFNDGWILQADEEVNWREAEAPIKRYVVLDNGDLHVDESASLASQLVRRFSRSQEDLRLWYPTGYIEIRPDGTNHWIHTNQEKPITVWAGPDHA